MRFHVEESEVFETRHAYSRSLYHSLNFNSGMDMEKMLEQMKAQGGGGDTSTGTV